MLGETAEDPAVDGSHDVIEADRNASHLGISLRSVLCGRLLLECRWKAARAPADYNVV